MNTTQGKTSKLQNDTNSMSLELFDAMGCSVVLLDSQKALVGMSAEAARLLNLPAGTNFEQQEAVIKPLSELAKGLVEPRSSGSFNPSSLRDRRSDEIEISGGDGRMLSVYVHSRVVGSHGESSPKSPTYILSLYDLASLRAITAHIDQLKRVRNLVISKKANDEMSGGDSTDLLAAINNALATVDSLILPFVKVNINVAMPSLLKAEPGTLFCILSHLLCEASDFAGPGGTVQVQSLNIKAKSSEQSTASAERVDVTILATRLKELPAGFSPLESYIYRRMFPNSASTGRNRDQLAEQATAETSPIDASSLHLSAAQAFVENCDVDFCLERDEPNELSVVISVPLFDQTISTLKNERLNE